MSKKRASTEASNDEQTPESSDSVFQQEDNTKRAKLDSLCDTTLQDLPIEMLERILVKVVAMEVKDMKLAKSVWKEKADLVISRLRTVCSQWSYILTTNFFRNELHRALDGIAQETIRLEILHESLVGCLVLKVATMKDDIVVFSAQRDQDSVTSATSLSFNIRVYDRNNMAEVKDVIALPGIQPDDIAVCEVSNCLYVLDESTELHGSSILRITRDEGHLYKIQPWISDLRRSILALSVSVKGNLILISTPEGLDSRAVGIYSENGFLQHAIMLSPDIEEFKYVRSVIQKSNGNLVLKSVSEQFTTVLTEIDTDGIIQRQYNSTLSGKSGVNFADAFDRIVLIDPENGIELLDCELNLLEFTGPQPNQVNFSLFSSVHYISERNEVVGTCAFNFNASDVTIFRFSEEYN